MDSKQTKYSTACILIIIWTSTFLGCSKQGAHEANKEQEIPPSFRELNDLTVYPDTVKVDTLRLKKVRTYAKHYMLHGKFIPPIAVDDLNRVFMLNKPKLVIDVYDAEGNLVTMLGRKGRGPGEFREVRWMQILDNHLYVYDRILKRFQVFSLQTLSYANTVQTIPKNLNRFPNLSSIDHEPVYVISDSTFLYRFEDKSKLFNGMRLTIGKKVTTSVNYYIMNQNRRLRPDTVLHQKGQMNASTRAKGMNAIVMFPFSRRPLFAISNSKRVYAARTQNFMFKVYNLKGKYLRSFYHPYQHVSLSDSQIDSVFETASNIVMKKAMRKVSQKMDMPATWPALHSMKIDGQNRLWVSTIVKNTNNFQWWVMNNQGKLLARFRWPRDRPIKAIRNGYVYTVKKNQKKGTYKVIKYKTEFQKN